MASSSGNQSLQVSSPSRTESGSHRSRRKSKAEWESVKQRFTALYVDEDLSLKEVMIQLEKETQFKATTNQWKFMIKNWQLDKKAKGHEMVHIIKIQKERRQQNPRKETEFTIRGRRVDKTKIERYIKEHDEVPTPKSPTPSAIMFRTPPLSPQNPFESEEARYIDWEGLEGPSNEQLAQMGIPFGYFGQEPTPNNAYPLSDDNNSNVSEMMNE